MHSRNIELPMGFAIRYDFLVNSGIATIRDQTFGVFQFIIFVPHLSRVPNDNRHAGINDDIGWNVLGGG